MYKEKIEYMNFKALSHAAKKLSITRGKYLLRIFFFPSRPQSIRKSGRNEVHLNQQIAIIVNLTSFYFLPHINQNPYTYKGIM